MVSMSDVELVKSVTGLCPRYAHRMGHLPPLDFCRCWRRSLKVLLWRLILSLAVYLHPPRMCVFVSGDWHFGANEGRAVFSFASVYMYSPCYLK